MKNKNTVWILVLIFAVLLIGSSVLYNALKDTVERDSLMIQENTNNNELSSADTSSENSNDASTSESSPDTSEDTHTQEDTSDVYAAPDFTVTDLTGEEVHLSDFIGKPVIVNFWASWCGPCKSEMPAFEDAYNEYKDDIQFLIVNMTDGSRETVESASTYIEEQGYTFPVFYDTQSSASYTYQVYAIPSTYFIDAEGNLIAGAQSAIDRETLQKGIDMIYTK